MKYFYSSVIIFLSIIFTFFYTKNRSEAFILQSTEFEYHKPEIDEIDEIRNYIPDDIELIDDKVRIMSIDEYFYGIKMTYEFIRLENHCFTNSYCLNIIIGKDDTTLYGLDMAFLGPYVSLTSINEPIDCDSCLGKGKMIYFKFTDRNYDRAVRVTNFGLIF